MANSRLRKLIGETFSAGRVVLCPAIHAARHDHLWSKLTPSGRGGVADLFPFLEKR